MTKNRNKIQFTKAVATGNDFIIVDNRAGALTGLPGLSKELCDRKRGVGADGLLVVEKSKKTDFKMRIFTGLARIIAKSGNKKFAIVTHNRVERLLIAWLAQGCPNDFSFDFCVFAQKGLPTGAMEQISILPSRLYSPEPAQS